MELSQATTIVREANEVCPNLWFYIKTIDGKFMKKRLVLNSKGELREFKKKSADTLQETDPSDWARLKPRYTSKLQIVHDNINRIKSYLSVSGLWEIITPELLKLERESEAVLMSLYEATHREQRIYLQEHGYKFITTQRLRTLLYDNKCVRPVYFGKGNAGIKKKLQTALTSKDEFVCKWRMTYDNTIHYQPREMIATYSEEYRDQDSGHYYVLLDDMHAAFQQNINIKTT